MAVFVLPAGAAGEHPMSEQEFIAIAEKALAEAARAGRAGVRFQVPRTAPKYWEEVEGLSAEFLRVHSPSAIAPSIAMRSSWPRS